MPDKNRVSEKLNRVITKKQQSNIEKAESILEDIGFLEEESGNEESEIILRADTICRQIEEADEDKQRELLKELKEIQKELSEKKKQNKGEIKSFTEEDAEQLIKAALGADVFERERKDEKTDGEKEMEILRTKKIAIHGRSGRDFETGEVGLKTVTDLDGTGALWLLQEVAGNKEDVEFVHSGRAIKDRLNVDTGGKSGFKEEEGVFYIDHHTTELEKKTSATEIIYNKLCENEMISDEDKKWLGKLVQYITKVDNADYKVPDYEDFFEKFHRTLYGMKNQFNKDNFDILLKFFQDGRRPNEILSDEDLEKYNLVGIAKGVKTTLDYSHKELKRINDNGLIVRSKKFGEIAIDIDGKIGGGWDSVRGFGSDVYILWSPDNDSFFISSEKPLNINLGQGEKIRSHMWIKPLSDKNELTVSLKEVLKQLEIEDTDELPHEDENKNELDFFLKQESAEEFIKSAEEPFDKNDSKYKEQQAIFFENKYLFVLSKYTDRALELRSKLLELKSRKAEMKYENKELDKKIKEKLKEVNKKAEEKINILVGKLIDKKELKNLKNLKGRIKEKALSWWDKQDSSTKHLVAEDMETALGKADKKAIDFFKKQFNKFKIKTRK